MAALIFLLLNLGASFFKPKIRLEAENAALRQQLIVLQRKVRGRVEFTNGDRLFFIQLYRWFPSILKAITTFRPETLVRWHRAGFRRYWRWKSRNLGGRPQIAVDLRALIRRMSVENLLWGAPRIAPATGRIQTRETNYLQIVTSGLHRTAGPYKVHGREGRPVRSALEHLPA